MTSITQDMSELSSLPAELSQIVAQNHGSDLLEAVARASFGRHLIDDYFVYIADIIPDAAARWINIAQQGTIANELTAISCFARILPFATCLESVASHFIAKSRLLSTILSPLTSSGDFSDENLRDFLVSYFRLVSHNLDTFGPLVKPIWLSSLLNHGRAEIRLLALECLSLVMRLGDASRQTLQHKHVGTNSLLAPWEDQEIDYRLFKLHEEQRWQNLKERLIKSSPNASNMLLTRINTTNLVPYTGVALLGGVFLPSSTVADSSLSRFVEIQKTRSNLANFATCLKSPLPVLLKGPSGSGKTMLIREAARRSGTLSTLITLHLNEQTDPKSLLGVYTSSSAGDGFVWQAGILTKAVQEGRWVVIEDIDRLPAEIIGLLQPLVERNELFLPSRKQRLRPKEGFRIIGTICSQSASSRQAPNAQISSWNTVTITAFSSDDIAELLLHRYNNLEPFLSSLIKVHTALEHHVSQHPDFRAHQSRKPSTKDLFKWCRRLDRRLLAGSSEHNKLLIPETFMIDALKDAIDCYAGHFNSSTLLEAVCRIVAENLNIAPTAAQHALVSANPVIQELEDRIKVGRGSMPRSVPQTIRASKASNFAPTRRSRMTMEAILVAAQYQEPMLLVGETGVGKTTILQQVAQTAEKALSVVNLSNQSEASDLLGGLKPVTPRSLVVPLLDDFTELFDKTFAANKNAKFLESINKAFIKQRWQRLFGHWEEAIQLARKSLFAVSKSENDSEARVKRRKLDDSRFESLRLQWEEFAGRIRSSKTHVLNSDRGQVFTFVESRLVQAVRRGDWLLLDEINLASSETLDCIISLLRSEEGQGPSILLAESGNIERINAHADFRVFAAMNPATDTGKKDLAPAIRTQFTELFVHGGDDDYNDLVAIIETYLRRSLENDKKAASDLAKAYLALKILSVQHRLTDGSGDLPHFSLRSLTRCLQFVQLHAATHGLRRAMYDGLQMSFFTALDSKSQGLAAKAVTEHVFPGPHAKKNFALLKSSVTYDPQKYVNFEQYAISKGNQKIEDQTKYIITKSVRTNLINLSRAASMKRFPVLLQGPTSAGKTSMVEYLAKISGNKFIRINNHEHTDLQEYLGSYASNTDGRLEFREGVLVEALRKGYWIVLDELNLAPSDVLEALNRLLDDNRELLIPETQELIKPHPNFMLFATQNPAGLYGGRKRLSRAFRNRFLEIHVDNIPDDELETILQQRSNIAPSDCKRIVDVYRSLSIQRQSTRLFESRNSFATLRDLFRWASRRFDNREQLAEHGYMLLAERVRDQSEKQIVKKTIEDVLRVKIDVSSIYCLSKIPEHLQRSTSVIWTPAMRRLFCLVSVALKHNEPVLLVGATGCGKTQVCQSIAQAFDSALEIYNAHANTETGDLIGSQRPVRHKSELAATLRNELKELRSSQMRLSENVDIDLDEMIAQFDRIDTSELDNISVLKVRNSIAAYRSLFTWNDGSLIRAMKAGSHFLLDEISLAEDSVLERLNSLLEPSRTILLAEKGADDNRVMASSGFQFLATMNPGGDYGKRELSAALRNRLTEIWVPPLTDDEDIQPILEAKLASLEKTATSKFVDFARFFQREIQGSSDTTLALRTLLSWTDFVSKCGVDRPFANTMLHGAAMTFIDSIGAAPSGSVAVQRSLKDARNLCLEELSRLFGINAIKIYYATPQLHLDGQLLTVGDFSLARSSTASDTGGLVMESTTTLRNAMRLVRALQASRPVLLEGNPGVGKTAIVASIATLCGKALTRINLSEQTDLMDLFGADAPANDEKIGSFAWKDGPLLQAMQLGDWVLLDEMNLATQSVLEGLNACLDHRQEVYIAELDKTFKCHPNFMLFATQNPHHQGGGRKGLPASFVNRFTVVYADAFEKSDLLHICSSKYPTVPIDSVNKMVSTVESCQNLIQSHAEFTNGGPWELNLRDLTRWLSLCILDDHTEPSDHFGTVIGARFRTQRTKDLAHEQCRLLQDAGEESFFTNLSPRYFQIGTTFIQRDVEFQPVTSMHKRPPQSTAAMKAICTGINHRWPVIITGPTGSGKSSMIRYLAAMSGANLVELPMTADIDTADLIGGYEQYDPLRLVSDLQNHALLVVNEIIRDVLMDEVLNSSMLIRVNQARERLLTPVGSMQELGTIIDNITREATIFSQRLTPIAKAVANYVGTSKGDISKFVWNDGVLVDALLSGSWLVLDNANLCNPSVLDRLNSLMEDNGSLIITEQHGFEGSARVIKPHPKFRIILTTNPRFGELSRAVRNRSLEVSLDQSLLGASLSPVTPFYATDSEIWRLRHLFNSQSLTRNASSVEGLEPYVESLSARDLRVMAELPFTLGELDADVEAISRLKLADSSSYDLIISPSRRLEAYFSVGDMKALPFSPLVNEPLLRLSCDAKELQQLSLVSHIYDLSVVTARIQLTLENMMSGRIELDSRSWLAQTMPASLRTRQISPVIPAFPLLLELSSAVSTALTKMTSYLAKKSDLEIIEALLWLLKDWLSLFSGAKVDLNEVRSYIEIFHDTSQHLRRSHSQFESLFSQTFRLIGESEKMTSGYALRNLWPTWRGSTSSTRTEHESKQEMRELISYFDNLCRVLPHPRKELANVRTRLIQAAVTVPSRPDAGEEIFILKSAIHKLSEQSQVRGPFTSHFEKAFVKLAQEAILHGKNCADTELQTYLLCSDEVKTSPGMPSDSATTSVLQKFMLPGIFEIEEKTFSHDYSAGISMSYLLQCQQSLHHQPLHRLESLLEEVDILLESFGRGKGMKYSEDSVLIRSLVYAMIRNVLEAMGETNTTDSVKELPEDQALRVQLKVMQDEHNSTVSKEDTQVLGTILSLLESPTHLNIGKALLATTVLCLRAFVPDRVYDPASYPILLRKRHELAAERLSLRLQAWKTANLEQTGQHSSLKTRLLQERLADLGPAPAVPRVYRSSDNKLQLLQTEFTNILRNIVESDIAKQLLACGDKESCLRTVPQLLKRLKVSADRLVSNDHTYCDLTEPIVSLLHAAGLATRTIASGMLTPEEEDDYFQKETSVSAIGRALSNSFLRINAPQPQQLSQDSLSISSSVSEKQIWHQINQIKLQYPAARSTSQERSGLQCRIAVLFDGLYARWKKTLDRDQEAAEKESRYYSYRGEDDDAAINDRDLQELFPTGEATDEIDGKQDDLASQGSRRIQANDRPTINPAELAKVHRTLLHERDLRYLLDASLTAEWSQQMDISHHGIGKDFGASDLPDALMGLERHQQSLASTETPARFNIYTESCLAETRKLLNIVGHAQDRFGQIARAWPDHSVPPDVLQFCQSILSLPLNDPLVKLLTKTEKFLEIVSQWQMIASKEWSVQRLVDDTKSLIIHWRQLELASWSKLLDNEDEKQQELCDHWYMIAFESVVHNALHLASSVSERGQLPEVHDYQKSLAKTIEDFLRLTTLGQFSRRLNLLKNLAAMLKDVAISHTSDLPPIQVSVLQSISDAVMNVTQHYSRYEESVNRTLADGRLALEKNVTEQIKLASWKDTNIAALKESARRSHFKLFKVVRKYRQLLTQSLPHLASNFKENDEIHSSLEIISANTSIQLHKEHCAQSISGWQSRPERLTDPEGATMTIRHVYKSKMVFNISEHLAVYLQDLIDNSARLRKATPQVLTDDNTGIVKDLKQQKRRLLAETMKQLAHMGVQRNLSQSRLAAQDSVTNILARLPTFEGTECFASITVASIEAFHELLDTLPGARDAVLGHSNDLTDGETRRGLGYLEGFLEVTIKQRESLALLSQNTSRIKSILPAFSALSTLNDTSIMGEASDSDDQGLMRLVDWLPSVLDIYIDVLRIQQTHAKLDINHHIVSLENYRVTFMELRLQSEPLRVFPSGLTLRDIDAWKNELLSLLNTLQNDIDQWCLEHQSLQYLSLQLKPLLQLRLNHDKLNGTTLHTFENFDLDWQIALNHVFAAIQGMTACLDDCPADGESPGWLVRASGIYIKTAKILPLPIIIEQFSGLLSAIARLDHKSIPLAISLLASGTPILQQFILITENFLGRFTSLHRESCRLANFLGKTFTSLAKEGFCTPSPPSDGEGQSGKVEQGTGLGEGEASEDISKDVGDDEDLTDLAQEKDESSGAQNMDKSNDAVDMGQEDLEGQMESGDERESQDDEQDDPEDSEHDDIDEEIGSVDDLDTNAVDEKMWDDAKKDAEQSEKEMKSEKGPGQSTDDQTALEEGKNDRDQTEAENDAEEATEEAAEDENGPQAEGEAIDPQLPEENALDMPDDLQLNGDDAKSEFSDQDMDDLSNMEQDTTQQETNPGTDTDEEMTDVKHPHDDFSLTDQEADDEEVENEVGIGSEEEDGVEQEDKPIRTENDEPVADQEIEERGDSGAANTSGENQEQQQSSGINQGEATESLTNEPHKNDEVQDEENAGADDATGKGGHQEDLTQARQDEGLKELADALEQYHQRREIFSAQENRQDASAEMDLADVDLEHAEGEEAVTQAIGSTDQDSSQNVDRDQAIEASNADEEDNLPMPDNSPDDKVPTNVESLARRIQQPEAAPGPKPNYDAIERNHSSLDPINDLMELDEAAESSLEETEIMESQTHNVQPMSMTDAEQLWSLTTKKTQSLSLMLTEQLRLILQPTTATKLRGDFRTGKRLNIRRIIPYIASGFKRDKIWMRRSVPSKRNYQVMLAVDDSKSMAESGADVLALETLCMLSRSLSMLEVGQLAVVAFGQDYSDTNSHPNPVKVAHAFTSAFSANASGPTTFANFSFGQNGTNIKSLLSRSLDLFQDARAKSTAREAAELWQLQIIISDGHIGSDPDDSVRRLVRKAREEKIMSIFVFLDNGPESIVQLESVTFEKDPKDENALPKPVRKRYLESFPFQYYVIVRDISELPHVLARVLKTWFENVAEST